MNDWPYLLQISNTRLIARLEPHLSADSIKHLMSAFMDDTDLSRIPVFLREKVLVVGSADVSNGRLLTASTNALNAGRSSICGGKLQSAMNLTRANSSALSDAVDGVVADEHVFVLAWVTRAKASFSVLVRLLEFDVSE